MSDNISTIAGENTTVLYSGTSEASLNEIPLYLRVPPWACLSVSVCIIILFVVGMFGNVLLIAGLRRKKQRSSTDTYITSLACGDIVSVACFHLDYIRYTDVLWQRIGSDWLCRCYFYTQGFGSFLSTLLVFGIGLDRFFNVFYPYSTGRLKKAATPFCLAAFLTSAVYGGVFPIASHQTSDGACMFNSNFDLLYAITVGTGSAVALTLAVILGCLYGKIAIFLRKRQRSRNLGGHRASVSAYDTNSRYTRTRNLRSNSPVTPIRTISIDEIMGQGRNGGTTEPRAIPGTNPAPEDALRSVSRTTITMMLVTIVYVVSSVLPSLGVGILKLTRTESETTNTFIFFAVRLRYICHVANPILFLMSSSEFRKITLQMLQVFCKHCRMSRH